MLMRLNVILAAALVLAFSWVNPVSAEPCATWKAAEKALRSAWAKGYPNEKIIKII